MAGGFHFLVDFLVDIGLLVLGDEETGSTGPMVAFGIARSQGLLIDVDHATLGRVQLPGTAR
ncbi:hypothetical protein [Pseudonocardia adelaidensis]|uniref:Uncharacterized protein n=1 Tax=Pseudonocardia adelaidensis TaxID=648754 RepID=A0ABP9NEG3_9PSEU